MTTSSYRDLDIYKLSMELFYESHAISLQLPKYELYELGSQLRRSSDSVVSNIVEGYGRKRYKAEFIRFLVFSHSSTDETINHLEKLKKLYSEHNEQLEELINKYNTLGAKLNSFIRYVEKNWKT